MLKKVFVGYATKKVWKLVKKHGMKIVLQALIEMTDDMNEDYMRRLNTDLRTALRNYENRYDD